MHATHGGADGFSGRPDIPEWQYESQAAPIARQNAHLRQENERLRSACEALTASAEAWIRLYERALDRARRAESRIDRLAMR